MAVVAVPRPLPTVFQSTLPSLPSSPIASAASSSTSHFPSSNPPSAESWFHLSSDSHPSSHTSSSDHSHPAPLSPSLSHPHEPLPKGARPASPQVNPIVQHCCDVHQAQSAIGRGKGEGLCSDSGNLTRSKSLSSWKLEWRGVTKVVKWAFPRSSKAESSRNTDGMIHQNSSSNGGNAKRASQSPSAHAGPTPDAADAEMDERMMTGHRIRIGKTRDNACERQHAPSPWRQSTTSVYSGDVAPEQEGTLRGGPDFDSGRIEAGGTSSAVRKPLNSSAGSAPTSRKLRKPGPKFFISPSTSTTFVDRVCDYDAAYLCSDPYSHPHPRPPHTFSSRSELGHAEETLRLASGSYLELRGSGKYENRTLKERESLATCLKYREHAPDQLFSASQRTVSEIGHGGRELDHVQLFSDSAALDASSRCTFSDHDHPELYRTSYSHSHSVAPALSAHGAYEQHRLGLAMAPIHHQQPRRPHTYHDLPSTSSISHQQQHQMPQPQPQRRSSLASLARRKSFAFRSATTLCDRGPAHSAPPNPTRSPRKLQKPARSATLPQMYHVQAQTLHQHHHPQPVYSLPPPLPSTLSQPPPSPTTPTQTASAVELTPTSPRKPFLRSLSNLNLVITPRTPPKTTRKLYKRTSPVSPTPARDDSVTAIIPSPRNAEKAHRTPSRSASILRSRITSAFVRRSVTPDAESSESSGSSGLGSGSDQQKTPSEECAAPDLLAHDGHVSDLEKLVESQMAPAHGEVRARPSILRTESNRRWTVAAADVPDDLFIEELERLRRLGLRAMEVHGSRRTSATSTDEGVVLGGREEAAALLEANSTVNSRASNGTGDLEAELKEELEWLHARRAILTCRELVRTEKTYQQRLQELADGSVSDAVPSLLLQYLPALIGASKILSQRFFDDMSTLGIADAFPSVATALESAFVPWSGVVGEFFKGPREDAPSARKRKSTLTGVLTEEDMPTDFGAVKVRCLSMHGFDKRSSTSLVSQAPPTSATLVTGLTTSPTSSSSLQNSASAVSLSSGTWLTRPPVAFTSLETSSSTAVDGSLLTSSDLVDSSHSNSTAAFATLRKSLSRRESRIKQEKERRKLPSFRDLAILPTQRVTRYVLLFQDLLKHTPRSSPSYATVQNALDAAVRLAQKCDRAQGNSAFLHPA